MARLIATMCAVALIGLAGLAVLNLGAAGGARAADPGVRAFVIPSIYVASDGGEDACPAMSASAAQIFYESLSPQEKAAAPPVRSNEFRKYMAHRLGFVMVEFGEIGAGNTSAANADLDRVRAEHKVPAGHGRLAFRGSRFAYDSCTNPDDFAMLNARQQPYTGRTAYGMNLDGRVSANDFVSPSGARGVDNELWRALGCSASSRDFGDLRLGGALPISDEAPTLVEIRGIDDARNDDSVMVRISGSADPLVRDGAGRPLDWVSYTANGDARWITEVRGRILDGVLTTERATVRVRQVEGIMDSYRELHQAVVRLEFKSDGSIQGGIYGFHTLSSIEDIYQQSTQIGGDLAGLSCPGIVAAVRRHADAEPDQTARKNTAISSALSVLGRPAFVIGAGSDAVAAN